MMRGLPFLRRREKPAPAPVPPVPATAAPGPRACPPGIQHFGRAGPGHYTFEAIPVVPVVRLDTMIAEGGPVWPDWNRAVAVRHQRNLYAVDRCPAVPAELEAFDGVATWGGFAAPQFGHFLAEHATRILPLLSAFPDAPMLFTLPPGSRATDLPAFFWQITAWLGLKPDNARFVTRPLRVGTLHAVPMAEQWLGLGAGPAYLDLLEGLVSRNRLAPSGGGMVYVARDGVGRAGAHNHAGEAYLCQMLVKLGFRIIRPESMPLREQLDAYLGARVLVFSEGSAIHGRQLLGRLDQHVVVLNRRPNLRVSLDALRVRAPDLTYVEATAGLVSVLMPDGKPWMPRSKSIYDVVALFDCFDLLGLNLRGVWDRNAYEAARDADIRAWMAMYFQPRQPIDHAASATAVAGGLRKLGLGHLADEVPGIVRGGAA